ncbi:MAG TPA: hypothetical protein VHY37_07830 [Tepidisphaeraceae bacterium]|jgi:adenylate cyclase class IV|nr:hypothetical protein [Tepidisphaeraceae bacterium]
MPNEIEAKMRVLDHGPIREKLRQLGAEPRGVAIEAACHVELDELPRLGTFVEIEGPGESAVI